MPSDSAQALAPPPHRPTAHCLLLEADRRLTRLLVNVTVDRSLWPVHVVLHADATVADLVRAAVAAYEREGRRPPLAHGEAADFELHFSKYSLESLRPEEKVMDLGSRNFFLCVRRPAFPCSPFAGYCSRGSEPSILDRTAEREGKAPAL